MTKSKLSNNTENRQKSKLCAVIGNPISHSLSPFIHKHFASQCNLELSYNKILGEIENIEHQINQFFNDDGLGLNVTLPFKKIAYEISEIKTKRALKAKAANTLWLNEFNQLCADNTDGLGLLFSLNLHTNLQDKNILLLGAGGAAMGVIEPLLSSNINSLTIANRSFEKLTTIEQQFPKLKISDFESLESNYEIIINATPSSINKTVPNIPSRIINNCLCLDMFYDKINETSFIQHCNNHNASKSIDGLEMLVGQAAASFEIWHNIKINEQQTLNYLRTYQW